MKASVYIPSDIIEEILFFIQADHCTPNNQLTYHVGPTLYSCLLINHQWCRLVIPKLWKHPFYYAWKGSGNEKLISTILSFLKETLRKPLICNGFVISQGSTFDYISMIKHLHYDYMLTSVESWCKNLVNSSGNNNVSMIIKVILRLFVDKSVELTSLFIWPNNVYLRHYNLNRYMELVEPEFNGLLKNLMSLHVETHSHYPSAKFLQKLSLIVRNVKKIHLRTPLLGLKGFPNDMEAGIAKNLCTLIQSQTKLEEFKLMSSFKFTPSFISSLSVHTDHLKSVALFETKIDEVDSWKVLTNCLNLERFEIINCVGLHFDFISLFYNVNNFKKLKWISMEKNQPNEINEELKTCAIHKYKDDLRFRLLKSDKVLNDICK